jgi:hypothetical protein
MLAEFGEEEAEVVVGFEVVVPDRGDVSRGVHILFGLDKRMASARTPADVGPFGDLQQRNGGHKG